MSGRLCQHGGAQVVCGPAVNPGQACLRPHTLPRQRATLGLFEREAHMGLGLLVILYEPLACPPSQSRCSLKLPPCASGRL